LNANVATGILRCAYRDVPGATLQLRKPLLLLSLGVYL